MAILTLRLRLLLVALGSLAVGASAARNSAPDNTVQLTSEYDLSVDV